MCNSYAMLICSQKWDYTKWNKKREKGRKLTEKCTPNTCIPLLYFFVSTLNMQLVNDERTELKSANRINVSHKQKMKGYSKFANGPKAYLSCVLSNNISTKSGKVAHWQNED
ncbi:hypothetical protein POVCU2_0051310 [Plasmodium ovale curtisi]|uniref:Uncharacterized protein n=1 Tax=Plasmodium ovale curtisi TaxID=864141 RepID=A0A1A8W7Y7_PLAOA|nr:hypothetical protein POVCU2_0051310 [Plasmodium ovale curtisi]